MHLILQITNPLPVWALTLALLYSFFETIAELCVCLVITSFDVSPSIHTTFQYLYVITNFSKEI